MKLLNRGIIPGIVVLFFAGACTTGGNAHSASANGTNKLDKQAVNSNQITRVIREEIQYADGLSASSTLFHYDAKGFLLGEEQMDGKGALVLKKAVVPSSDGRQAVVTSVNSSGEVQAIALNEYDAAGRIVKETLSNAKKEVQSQSEYSYDQQGNLISWITRGQSQMVVAKILYTVRDSLTTSMEIQDPSGQAVKHFDQEFNSAGQITSKTEKDMSGTVLSRVKFSYENGKLVKEDYLNGDAILQRTIAYVYNEKGQAFRAQFLDRKGKLLETRIQDFQVFPLTAQNGK